MENEYVKPSPWGTAIKWGLIGGVVSVILNYLVALVMGEDQYLEQRNSSGTLFSILLLIPSVVFLVLAQKEHKDKELGGYMSYARGIGVAVIYAIVVGIITAMYVYVTFAILKPEMVQTIKDMSIQQIGERDLTEEQLEQQIKMMDIFISPISMTIFSFLGNFFWLFVTGLISSAFTKKNAPFEG